MITIGHAYSAAFNCHGDWANARLIARRLRAADLESEVLVSEEGLPDLARCRAVVFGSPPWETLPFAWDRLVADQDSISGFLDAGGVVLVTGLAVTAFGQSLKRGDRVLHGMCLTDQRFSALPKRRHADGVWEMTGKHIEVIGALNTNVSWSASRTPMFTLEVSTNAGEPRTEGCHAGGLYATQILGPLLARNPALLTHIASRIAGHDLPPATVPSLGFAEHGYNAILPYLKNMLAMTESQRARATGGLRSPTG